uniref:SPRY domain-containing protein n=1 Tax=Leishmania guyanensis TaxID=5670 RepID=A0A1E1J2T9_LEIGU|nr:hypothetical protein, conserved [Leishmania guyanensis]
MLLSNDDKDAAAEVTITAAPEEAPRVDLYEGSGGLLTPRERCNTLPPPSSVSPLTTASTRTLSSDDDGEESSLVVSKRKAGNAHVTTEVGRSRRGTYAIQRTSAAPFRTVSGSVSDTVGCLRGRLAETSGLSALRSSTESLSALVSGDRVADAKSAEATASTELKELRQALKDKERDLVRLVRDLDKAKQAAAKAQTKSEELQAKWEGEKSAFADHKKGALTQRHELQKELRQAQTALRSAEQAQAKLQRELDKQKEKLATVSSRGASDTTTPVMTPRSTALSSAPFDNMLQAKVSSLESEKKLMRETIRKLEEQCSVAAAAASLAKTAEEHRSAAASKEAAETIATLKDEVLNLKQRLASQDAAVRDLRERADTLLEENEALKTCAKAERKPARSDVAVATLRSASTRGKGESEEPSLPMQPPRQVMALETPAEEAMAHLREALTAAQSQAGVYKCMHEHAKGRIRRLEAELAASRSAEASASPNVATVTLRDTMATLKEQLASRTAECGELRQCVQERTEEATTLQSALQEVEGERDAQLRQIRDLQFRIAEAEGKAATLLAVQKTERPAALEEARVELLSVRADLQVAAVSAQEHQEETNNLRSLLGDEQRRCAHLEEERRAAQEEAAAKSAAADASKQQADHYRKKARQLTKKLGEALRELSVLGEEYERVCEDRQMALSQPDTKNKMVAEARSMICGQPVTYVEADAATGDTEAAIQAVSPFQARRTTSVSRSLSDALLSANRQAAINGVTSTAWAIAALDQERQAREQLELDVLSLYSKVSAIEYLEQSSWNSAERGGACAATDASSADLTLGSSHGGQGHIQQPSRMPSALQPCPSTSGAPGRARSPQATHALDPRYFDPTMFTCSEGQPRSAGVDSINLCGHAAGFSQQLSELPQRGRSLSAQALQLSPSAGSRGDAQSPSRAFSLRSMALVTSPTALQAYRSDSIAGPSAASSELPATSVYYSTGCSYGTDGGAGQRARVELQFSDTAGRLLRSMRGRRVQRPVFPAAENEAAELDVCCTAIGSISHTIYASHMLAAGHYHLKHTFRFIIRVLNDCRSGGDILIGFSDRYVPMESFGAKRNALRYSGCYYLSLRDGCLFCPAQDVSGAAYEGWSAAAARAAERRCSIGVGPRQDGGALSISAQGIEAPLSEACATSSPARKRALLRPECVARAGDEIACTLRTDDRSISYSWNGVECGVAFTGVPLSPSLYPCVEINASGGAVELL